MSAPLVALATYSGLAELSDDDRPLVGALGALGLKAEPVVWDDPRISWSRYASVVVRSTWDYHLNPSEFAAWIARVESSGASLWNPPAVLRVNTDKTYLRVLVGSGIPVVPTAWVSRAAPRPLGEILAAHGWAEAVVKPTVSANSWRTRRVRRDRAVDQEALDEALLSSDAMVQPFLTEIVSEGEWSLIFLGGAYSHAILKAPKKGDFRVQEEHGGVIARAEPPAEMRIAAERALSVATAGSDWLYARVDGVRRGGRLEIMEIELVEPSLYLRFDPASPARLARAIAAKRGKIVS